MFNYLAVTHWYVLICESHHKFAEPLVALDDYGLMLVVISMFVDRRTEVEVCDTEDRSLSVVVNTSCYLLSQPLYRNMYSVGIVKLHFSTEVSVFFFSVGGAVYPPPDVIPHLVTRSVLMYKMNNIPTVNLSSVDNVNQLIYLRQVPAAKNLYYVLLRYFLFVVHDFLLFVVALVFFLQCKAVAYNVCDSA